MNKRSYTEQQYQSGVFQYNIVLDCTDLEDLLPIKLLTGRCYNGIRSTKRRLRLNV